MKMIIMLIAFCLALSPIPDIREATTDLVLYECPNLICEMLTVVPEGSHMTGNEDSAKLVKGIVWTFVIYEGVGGWVDSRHLIRIYPAVMDIKNA